MEQFDEKQRQIIRLAYTSKDPELRRRAVAHVVTAYYTPEFVGAMKALGGVFTHKKNKEGDLNHEAQWQTLSSQEQTAYHNSWEAGKYKGQEGWPPPPGEGDGGGKKEKKDSKHKDRTELRGVGKKGMDDSGGLTEKDIYDLIPRKKLDSVRTKGKGLRGEDIKAGLMSFSFHELDLLRDSARYMAKYGVDDDYGKENWLVKNVGMDQGEINSLYKALSKKLEQAKGRLYANSALGIANDHDLEGSDADAVHQFRKDKPITGRRLTPEQLKQKFLQGPWADAETKARVREMSGEEFEAFRNAIFDEDEEELASAVEGEAAASVAASTKTADHHEEEGDGGDKPWSDLNLLAPPPKRKKDATLTPLGRKMVRMAHASTDKEIRRKLVRRAKAELNG